MNGWLAPLVDAVIALTVLEALGLAVWHRRTGGGVAPREIGLNLGAGLFLMLALRAALGSTVGQAPGAWAVLPCLAAAGLTHLADLHKRWQAPGQAGATGVDREGALS